MLVVSNTSPILNLSVIGHLGLLEKQFGQVLIPQAVVAELRLEENLKGNAETRGAIEQGWLKVAPVKKDRSVLILQQTLDWGESEAIALAIEVGVRLVCVVWFDKGMEGYIRTPVSILLHFSGVFNAAAQTACNGPYTVRTKLWKDERGCCHSEYHMFCLDGDSEVAGTGY